MLLEQISGHELTASHKELRFLISIHRTSISIYLAFEFLLMRLCPHNNWGLCSNVACGVSWPTDLQYLHIYFLHFLWSVLCTLLMPMGVDFFSYLFKSIVLPLMACYVEKIILILSILILARSSDPCHHLVGQSLWPI